MNKLFSALVLAISAHAYANCNYPLDATQQQLDLYPPMNASWEVMPYINGQTGEFLINETGINSSKFYAAFSDTGINAMTDAYAAGEPGGDMALPGSGVARVQVKVNDFPSEGFSMQGAVAGLTMSIMTGNQQGDLLSLTMAVVSFSTTTSNFRIFVSGNTISNGASVSISQSFSYTPPLPKNATGGFYLNLDTREIGVTANGVDQPALRDSANNPLRIPESVDSVALGLGGFLSNIQTGEALIGRPIGGTLITNLCHTVLPNDKPYPGKGNGGGPK